MDIPKSLMRLLRRPSAAKGPRRMGYLHIGSRLPLDDMSKACRGNHSLVDPYFASLPAPELRRLRKAYPNFEFSPKTAHGFLNDAIAAGDTYVTVRIDAPYTGIIDESSGFGSLCAKMSKALVPHGHVLITTDCLPDAEGVVHKVAGMDTAGMYAMLKGRGFGELPEGEAAMMAASVTEEPTANMAKELKKAGFAVSYFTAPPSAIGRSEAASKRSLSGKKIYMVVATKK